MSIKFLEIKSEITEPNLKFLYLLLSNRKFNISHKSMPSFEDHKKFVASNPYYRWFIVLKNECKVGTIYINNDNSIGLNILENYKNNLKEIILEIEKRFKPQKEIKSLRSKNFFYNVSPKDEFFINTLKSLDYEISKISFRKFLS